MDQVWDFRKRVNAVAAVGKVGERVGIVAQPEGAEAGGAGPHNVVFEMVADENGFGRCDSKTRKGNVEDARIRFLKAGGFRDDSGGEELAAGEYVDFWLLGGGGAVGDDGELEAGGVERTNGGVGVCTLDGAGGEGAFPKREEFVGGGWKFPAESAKEMVAQLEARQAAPVVHFEDGGDELVASCGVETV